MSKRARRMGRSLNSWCPTCKRRDSGSWPPGARFWKRTNRCRVVICEIRSELFSTSVRQVIRHESVVGPQAKVAERRWLEQVATSGHNDIANNSMKKFIALIFTACTVILAGCCTAHHASKWEYMTVVTPNDAVPLEDASKGWVSKDETLNAML